MSRQWPENAAYVEAIQSSSNLGDPDVAGGTHEKKSNGMPRPYSGGFTTTFHVTTPTGEFALRCFTKGNDELEMRYRAITDWLTYVRSGAFCMAAYVPQGIRVNGRWWPVIKMAWVAGKQINTEIESQLGNPNHITHLRDRFRALVRELGILGVAHGDLQHGNIMVDRGELRLIDYDGIYLPALAHLTPSETGHKNFQHPGRLAAPFDGRLDRFSSLVIYTALSALSADASLWQRYNTDENLLFQASDIAEPATSPLFRDLRALPPAATLADRLAAAARLPYDQVPTLEQFIAGAFEIPALSATTRSAPPFGVPAGTDGMIGAPQSWPVASPSQPAAIRPNGPPPLPSVAAAAHVPVLGFMPSPAISSLPNSTAGAGAARRARGAAVALIFIFGVAGTAWAMTVSSHLSRTAVSTDKDAETASSVRSSSTQVVSEAESNPPASATAAESERTGGTDGTSDAPTPVPAEPTEQTPAPSQANNAGDDSSRQEQAIHAFYFDLSQKNYLSAYPLLSSRYRTGTSYDEFVDGYRTTISVTPQTHARADGSDVVDVTLDAVDAQDGGAVERKFVGLWHMVKTGNGGWLLDNGKFTVAARS